MGKNASTVNNEGTLGIIVVHGVGDHKAGEVLNDFTSTLTQCSDLDAEFSSPENYRLLDAREENEQLDKFYDMQLQRGKLNGRLVICFEAYWGSASYLPSGLFGILEGFLKLLLRVDIFIEAAKTTFLGGGFNRDISTFVRHLLSIYFWAAKAVWFFIVGPLLALNIASLILLFFYWTHAICRTDSCSISFWRFLIVALLMIAIGLFISRIYIFRATGPSLVVITIFWILYEIIYQQIFLEHLEDFAIPWGRRFAVLVYLSLLVLLVCGIILYFRLPNRSKIWQPLVLVFLGANIQFLLWIVVIPTVWSSVKPLVPEPKSESFYDLLIGADGGQWLVLVVLIIVGLEVWISQFYWPKIQYEWQKMRNLEANTSQPYATSEQGLERLPCFDFQRFGRAIQYMMVMFRRIRGRPESKVHVDKTPRLIIHWHIGLVLFLYAFLGILFVLLTHLSGPSTPLLSKLSAWLHIFAITQSLTPRIPLIISLFSIVFLTVLDIVNDVLNYVDLVSIPQFRLYNHYQLNGVPMLAGAEEGVLRRLHTRLRANYRCIFGDHSKRLYEPLQIRIRFSNVLKFLEERENISDLVVVAHSQGSVIALDELTYLQHEELPNLPTDITFITMGSPISHLYQYYFPAMYPDWQDPLWNPFFNRVKSWFHYYRYDDYVGTTVIAPETTRIGTFEQQCIGVGGHNSYWRDRHFVAAISKRISEKL